MTGVIPMCIYFDLLQIYYSLENNLLGMNRVKFDGLYPYLPFRGIRPWSLVLSKKCHFGNL